MYWVGNFVMADPFICSHINNLPLFQGLPSEQIDLVADSFEAYQFAPNEIVFRQGYPAQGLYVVVSGMGHLTRTTADGSEQLLAEVRGGQFLGEAALFRPMNESTSLRIIEEAVILFLSRAQFSELLVHTPEIRANLNSKFAPAAPPPSNTTPSANATSSADTSFNPAFKGQRPNEVILVFQRRRHWWALAQQAILPILLGLALIIVGLLMAGSGLSWFIFIVAVLLSGIWVGYLFYEWNDDYLIVTDQRLIHEENTLFGFREHISEIPFSSIQEANYAFPDPFAQLFQYGTLDIKTAGTAGNMRLPFIANPQKIQQLIINYRQNYQKTVREQNRDAIRSEIDRFLQDKGVAPAASTTAQTQAQAKPAVTPEPSLLATRFVNTNGEIVYRKHLSAWALKMTAPIITIFIGLMFFVLGLVSLYFESLGVLQIPLGVVLMIVGGVWAYAADWDWRKDMYIIGDNTIRIIHRRPLWLQDSNEQILLAQIDNVISSRAGFFNTIFDRGDVQIFLIGDNKPKVFEMVHQPAAIQDEISNRRARVLDNAKKAEVQNQHRTIAEYLDVYHERVSALNQQNAARQAPQATAPPDENPAPPTTAARDNSRPPRIPRVRND
jgi:hypothetical protein